MESMVRRVLQTALPLVFLACTQVHAVAQSEGTEYALRWKAGGPSTAADAVRLLALGGPQRQTVYQVEYFDIGKPPLLGKAPIARRRTSEGKVEVTLKYRADAVPASFDPKAACPLGKKVEVKRETDIALDAGLVAHPVKSISCERQGKKAIEFPVELGAVSRGCTTTMIRIEADGFKVEEWQFPKRSVIEVSMMTKQPAADLARFTQAVRRLPLDKLAIEDRSKSEAGSNCS